MLYFQVAHGVHNYLLYECLHPIVIVQRGREDVSADGLVHGSVLIKELLDSLPVNQHHLAASLVLVADVVTLQQTGEVLRISPVSTGEGEEQMKRTQVLKLGVKLKLVLAPVPNREKLLMSKLLKCVELKSTEVCS